MGSPYVQKLLKIPVIVKDGEIVLAIDQKPLPKFSDGASFDILIDPTLVPNKSRLIENKDDEVVPFLPIGTKLLAQVKPDNVPGALKKYLHEFPSRNENWALVEFILLNDVSIHLRTGRKVELTAVKCFSRFLIGKEAPLAKSINHAYSLIASNFEPHRISDSGNVFDKVLYQPDGTDDWVPLRKRRDEIQQGRTAIAETQTSKQNGLF